MVESVPFIIIVSTLLGILAGLGVGGGSLLILWLTLVVEMPQGEARIINLLFFLPCAVISCLFRWKQGALDIKKILPAILAGCVAAGIFSFVGRSLNTEFLKKCFGILLLVTGTRELVYRPK